MLKLTEEEKGHLDNLKKHPGFIILQRLEKDYVSNFTIEIMEKDNLNLDDENTKRIIKEASMYIRARKWVFDLVNNNTLWIARPKV